jgi:hypothetical protein
MTCDSVSQRSLQEIWSRHRDSEEYAESNDTIWDTARDTPIVETIQNRYNAVEAEATQ